MDVFLLLSSCFTALSFSFNSTILFNLIFVLDESSGSTSICCMIPESVLNRWPHLHNISWFLIENEEIETHCLCWLSLSLSLVSVLCPGMYLITLSSFLWFCSWAVWVLQVCSPSISHACSVSFAFFLIVSLCGYDMYVYVQMYTQLCMESRGWCSIFPSITPYFCFLRHGLSLNLKHYFS